jgi:quercetin dioxygenase-like cupin family protein
MIFLNENAKPVPVLPGLTRKTLVEGQSMMLCEFNFDAHVEIPIHAHPHEQVGYVAKGHVQMTIGGEKYELYQGDSYCAPSNTPHGAITLEPSIIVDTFYPPREDYR